MTFWIAAGAAALIVALLLAWTLVRRRGDGENAGEAVDIRVYRDQLATIERDLARGVVTEEEAERLTTEVKRRILEADRNRGPGEQAAPRRLTTLAAVAVGLVVILGAFGLYTRIGAPGYEDLPIRARLAASEQMRTERPSQADFEARVPASPPPDVSEEYTDLVAKLRAAVESRPGDIEGWTLLARNEAGLGRFPAAHAAQAKVVELKGEAAGGQDYATYAALLIQAAGGMVSVEADQAVQAALARDPANPVARYYAGLSALQVQRPDVTFQYWERLLRDSAPDAPWVPIIRDRIGTVAAMAGINYDLPPMASDGRGPTAADVAAASEMDAGSRQDMIKGMVAQLSERLATEGGPPSDWAKLIRAYGVLGNTDQARAIWEEAQQRFPDEASLSQIRQAAASAGVAE